MTHPLLAAVVEQGEPGDVRCHQCGQLVARRLRGALVLIGVEPLPDDKPDTAHIRVRCPSCKKRIRLDIAA